MNGLVLPLVGGVACLLVVALLVWLGLTYNKLIKRRNQARASWAQVDVQLKRRYDLVPNLVEAVKGYARHEHVTLEAVVAARTGAVSAAQQGDTEQRAAAENVLTQALGRMIALSEAYPDLKANQHFLQLMRDLSTTEDKIAYARQFYNSAVQTLTNTIESVPSNLVAGMFGFRPMPYFQAEADARGAVRVQF